MIFKMSPENHQKLMPGSQHGEVKKIPHTAEHYFYRAENPNSN